MNIKSSDGFTLIELLIAVAIVSILMTIAYPSYLESVTKSNRTDALIALSRSATLQEREYTQNNAYTSTPAKIGGATSNEGLYKIAVDLSACNGSCYTINATPAPGGTQERDENCWTMSLSHTGLKSSKTKAGVTNPAGTCW